MTRPDGSRRPLSIIVDLDGTLCDTTHRQHFMSSKPKDWVGFYNGIPFDDLNVWCYEIVKSFESAGYEIVFVTGRPEEHMPATTKWLQTCMLSHHSLFMRQTGDYRKDCDVKIEIFLNKIHPLFDVLFCVDDRKQVVDMWREIGLTCLQCAPGDF